MTTNSALTETAPRTSEETLREVVEALAPIERAAGSEGERQAAAWIADRLSAAGASARVEEASFRGDFAGVIAALAGAGAIAGAAASTGAGRKLGAAAGALVAGLIADDISNGSRPFRKAVRPERTTWNVVAEAGDPDAERTLVVLAHHDAAQTGFIFDPGFQEALIDRFPGVVERLDTSLPLWWGVLAGPLLATAGGLTRRRGLARAGALLSAASAATMADIQRSPTVPGANDNLTAVAVLVALAEALRDNPVEGVRVQLVSAGAEEVLQGGIYGYCERHLSRDGSRPDLGAQRRDRRRPVAGAGRGRGLRGDGGLLRPAVARPGRPRRRPGGRAVATRDAGADQHRQRRALADGGADGDRDRDRPLQGALQLSPDDRRPREHPLADRRLRRRPRRGRHAGAGGHGQGLLIEARDETRSYGRSAGLLTIALGLAGLLTYAFFAVASHTLDRDDYGDIVILWSAVFLLSSTLFRPVEQLLSRTLAERDQARAGSSDALIAAAKIQVGLCAAAVVGLLIARSPIERELFSGEALLFWVLIVSLIGFGFAFYARGFLAGRRQFGLYATLLVIEVSTRLAFALVVAVGIADGANLIALGIATAPVAVAIVIPLAVSRRPGSPEAAPDASPSATPAELTLGSGGAFAGAVLVMMLSEQVLINSGALFVRTAEGAAAAGFIFNVMMIARAPLVLFQAIAASLLPHLTRLRARDDGSSRDAFHASVTSTLILIVGFATAVTLGVAAIGPEVMQIAFGDKFEYDRLGLVVVAVGMGFYLVAASLNQAALAQGQAHRAATCWIACVVLFVVVNVAGVFEPDRAVEVGFTVSAALLAALLGFLYLRPRADERDEITPGSGA